MGAIEFVIKQQILDFQSVHLDNIHDVVEGHVESESESDEGHVLVDHSEFMSLSCTQTRLVYERCDCQIVPIEFLYKLLLAELVVKTTLDL